jgi:hypothetical protein
MEVTNMRIEKSYSRNINLGNYETLRLGITIKSDKEIKDVNELKEHSEKLTKLAEQCITEELRKIKEGRNGRQE